jgi:hypothetical protein
MKVCELNRTNPYNNSLRAIIRYSPTILLNKFGIRVLPLF